MIQKMIPWTRSNTKIFPYIQIPFTLATLFLATQGFGLKWWGLSVFVYFLTGCLGITVTFHRLLTHRAFYMPRWLEYFFSWFGAMGGTGSSVGWVAIHNEHHHHADRPGDPHSPEISGWRVLFPNYTFDLNKWSVRNLIIDPYHKALHDFYHVWLVLWAIALFAIDYRLGLFGFVAPVTIQIWSSVISNYVNHSIGYRNFETLEHSTNNGWVAALTWGEGWHNNHHRYPARWSFRVKWWEFDPSGMMIWGIKKIFTERPEMVPHPLMKN